MSDAGIAKEAHEVGMSAEVHALVIVREDGTVLAQNAPARQLMGEGLGKPCWDVVGGISGAGGLPCALGGARRLLARRPVRSADTCVSLMGERYRSG